MQRKLLRLQINQSYSDPRPNNFLLNGRSSQYSSPKLKVQDNVTGLSLDAMYRMHQVHLRHLLAAVFDALHLVNAINSMPDSYTHTSQFLDFWLDKL